MREAAPDLGGRFAEVDGVVVVTFEGLGDTEELDVGGAEAVDAGLEVEVLCEWGSHAQSEGGRASESDSMPSQRELTLGQLGDVVLLSLTGAFAYVLTQGREPLREGFLGRVEVDLLGCAVDG